MFRRASKTRKLLLGHSQIDSTNELDKTGHSKRHALPLMWDEGVEGKQRAGHWMVWNSSIAPHPSLVPWAVGPVSGCVPHLSSIIITRKN